MAEVRNRIRSVRKNIRKSRELESELEGIQGTKFHIPYFETEELQQIRLNDDHWELLAEFYLNPDPNDTDLKAGEITYQVTSVEVEERSGLIYNLNKIVEKTEFDASVNLTLDFGERAPRDLLRITDHPNYDHFDGEARLTYERDQLIFQHDWQDLRKFGAALLELNRLISYLWNSPQTVEEAREEAAKWEAFYIRQELLN